MKKITDAALTQKILEFSSSLNGVLTTADLLQLAKDKDKRSALLAISRLCKNKIITRVQRGLYVTANFKVRALVPKIYKESYISLLSVLADHAIIGTTPYQRTFVVTLKPRKSMQILNERIDFFKINKALFFGFQQMQNGIKIAQPEKAFLDLLYFYNLGARFSINPLVDINLTMLDKMKIKRYLKKYKNPKFKKFVAGLLL